MSTVRERPEPLSGKDEGYEVVQIILYICLYFGLSYRPLLLK